MRPEDRAYFATDDDTGDFDDDDVAPPRDRFALRTVVVHGLTFAAIFVALVYIEPYFERIFRGFDTKLPFITQLGILAAIRFQSYWYLIILGWLAGIGAIIRLDRTAGRNVSRAVGLTWIVLVLMFLAFVAISYLQPFMALRQKLN